MPKITVEYEVTHRVSVDVEVSEETVQKLDETYDFAELEQYGVTDQTMKKECLENGWEDYDFAVTAEDGSRIVPWSWE